MPEPGLDPEMTGSPSSGEKHRAEETESAKKRSHPVPLSHPSDREGHGAGPEEAREGSKRRWPGLSPDQGWCFLASGHGEGLLVGRKT